MKKIGRKLFKCLKTLMLTILIILFVFMAVRVIGKAINGKTPDNGINESKYIDVNGTKQWISIYGEDKDNPVLLYFMVDRVPLQVLMIMHLQENGQMCIP